jgi:hypothetical protein
MGSVIQCQICPEYTYSIITEVNYTCQRCDERKAHCYGGDGWGHNIIKIKPGFWRSSDNSGEMDFFECFDYYIYGNDSVCQGGYGYD